MKISSNYEYERKEKNTEIHHQIKKKRETVEMSHG